jgi:murein DD-endopeptidase MepM/ murein hydrolase activator NlpD
MPYTLPHSIRAHGGRAVVVALLLAVLVSPVLLAGAQASPVDPVPVGVWPLQPRPQVVRAFDPPTGPYGAGHRGVDLAGRVGERVHAALAGRVSFAGAIAGRGVVVVDHGSTRTTYEPVAAGVRVGDLLARGQPVGRLELAGSHCLPLACLHWGWIRGDTYLDPLLLVGGGPVRLLPLWRGPPATAVPIPVPAQPFAAVLAGLFGSPPPTSRSPTAMPNGSARASPRSPTRGGRSFAMRPVVG